MPDFDPYTLSVGSKIDLWGWIWNENFGKTVSNGAIAPHFGEGAESPLLETALVTKYDAVLKRVGFRVRLTVRGDSIHNNPDSYSPLVLTETIKVYLSIAAGRGNYIRHRDSSTDYLYARPFT